jgi:cyclopropane-fatty-acyl-phospholipid synthase
MKVAVVGAGASGLAAAYELARSGGAQVTVYEKEECLSGGHAKSVVVDGVGRVDLGFMVCNRVGTTCMLCPTPWVLI